MESAPEARQTAILDLWFGDLDPEGLPPRERMERWFRTDPAFDAHLRNEFGAHLTAAKAGALDAWATTPRGRLALIILLDQLSRNVHRGTPQAFEGDAKALALAADAVAAGLDRQVRPIERVFVYLPFEHAEDRAMQEQSVACFTSLLDEAPARARALFGSFLGYAIRHRDVVARFGRFPHRNGILGRPSTPEELRFLTEPGASFG